VLIVRRGFDEGALRIPASIKELGVVYRHCVHHIVRKLKRGLSRENLRFYDYENRGRF
jgi:hypothetical protein